MTVLFFRNLNVLVVLVQVNLDSVLAKLVEQIGNDLLLFVSDLIHLDLVLILFTQFDLGVLEEALEESLE